jgi:hypothetical protein
MKQKIALIVTIIAMAFVLPSCGKSLFKSDNYYQKQGQKWNDGTNGKMKCKNNANPTRKFKS